MEGEGNIDENPLFLDPANDNYNVCLGSPCIDTGDPNLVDPDSTRSDIGVFYPQHPECFVGNVWYVSVDGNDTTGDGSEGNPFRTIQHGINSSGHGDSVIVLTGTYEENIDLLGKKITLASNFIISGDTADIQNTVIDGDSLSAVVTIVSGEDSLTILKGFTIRNGGDSGIRCIFSDPIIEHNIIVENSANKGAGILFRGSNAKIRNNIIRDNSTPIEGYVYGGGIAAVSSSLIVTNNIIANNFTGREGGGIFANSSNLFITNNILKYNSANRGGGICSGYGANSIYRNNTIYGNSAFDDGPYNPGCGGAIYCDSYSTPLYYNNTISENSANRGGALYVRDFSTPIILNSILWGNSGQSGNEIYISGGTPYLYYSNIRGGWEGEGNVDTDPLFRDPENEDFHLMSTDCEDPYNSPCIDAGHPDSLDGYLSCIWGLGTIRSDMGAYGGGDSVMVGIETREIATPGRFSLIQNYPNPFNAFTIIRYDLPVGAEVIIEIYDILGRKIETLISEFQLAGSNSIRWDAQLLPSGIYFYRVKMGGFDQVNKCVLLK